MFFQHFKFISLGFENGNVVFFQEFLNLKILNISKIFFKTKPFTL